MSRGGVVFNGKFLTAPPSGVHRVAEELIKHTDQLLSEQGPPSRDWRLLCPRDAKRDLPLKVVQRRQVGHLTWQPWEQIELPLLARDDLLVNLCNLAPLAGRPGITMIHDAQVFISPESYSSAFRAWYQFALPRAGAKSVKILAVSEFSRRQLAEYGIADFDRIEVIHNGVDHLDTFEPDNRIIQRLGLGGRPFAVGLANTQKHKNIAMLIDTFSRPEMSAMRLVLVGREGADAFEARGLKIPPNVVFAGRVSDEEFKALFDHAVCLAFPSTTEGFGLPPLEAMVAGCPAIVAPCGALPEICGDAALYVDAHDPIAWAQTLLALADAPQERLRLATLGRSQAARFTWRSSAQRLKDIIEKTLEL